MVEFVAFDPQVEVSGQSLYSWTAGTQNRIVPVFAKHGIVLKPDGWYKQQAVLDTMRDFSNMMDLVSMGMNVIEDALFPPEVDSVEAALMGLDTGYHMTHRGGEIGYYAAEKVGDRHIRIEAKTPYASDFDYGVIYGLAKRFQPPDGDLEVVLDSNAPTRKKEADSCTYDVTW